MYNKLFTKILDSSIWLSPDPHRLVWITLLAAKDEDHIAHFASPENLAARARISVEETKDAIKAFESPDPLDPEQEFDGRRIERVPGGYLILNGQKYHDMVTKVVARERTRERVKRFRERKSNAAVTLANDPVTQSVSVSVSESDAYMQSAREQEVEDFQIRQHIEDIKTRYPVAGRSDWISAEKYARQIVLSGEGTWEQIHNGVDRYVRLCRATNRIPMNPARFFHDPDKPWSQPWPLPKSKADAAQDSNLAASQELLRRMEACNA